MNINVSKSINFFPTKEITVIRVRLGFPRLLKTWCTMLSPAPDVTGHGSKASVNISILTIEINHNVSRETQFHNL